MSEEKEHLLGMSRAIQSFALTPEDKSACAERHGVVGTYTT